MIIIYVLKVVKYVFMLIQFAIFRKLVLVALKKDNNVSSDPLRDILLKVAKKLDIQDYDVKIETEYKSSEEITFVDLTDKSSGSSKSLIIKKVVANEILRRKFLNEINFYSNILPTLQQFAQEIGIEEFDFVPKCHMVSSEEGREYLVLDNPKNQGLEVFDKKKIATYEDMNFIYKTYAKLHAISVLLKLKRPEEYAKMISNVFPVIDQFTKSEQMTQMFGDIYKICCENLIPGIDDDVIEDFQKYAENCLDLFVDSTFYKGDNPVLCHGDCWSQNMLFKYNENDQLEDIKLMDWRFFKLGSAVSDLSCSLYSRASKDTFDRLDDLLSSYYETFSLIFQQVGEDTEKIYTLSNLKEEWKRWATYGIFMGIISIMGKTTEDNDLVDLTDLVKSEINQEMIQKMFNGRKSEEFNTRVRELLVHCHEIGCL